MDERKSPGLFYGLLALAVALVIGFVAIARGLADIKSAGDQVTVTGSARRAIRSDFVVWRASIAVQSPSLGESSQELTAQTGRVRAFLRAQGIADTAIALKPIETMGVPEIVGEGRETGRVIAWRLTQQFEIRSADVDGITSLSQRAGDLIAQGVALQMPSPEYLYTRLADVRIALLEEATKDAKARAEVIARGAGGAVGAIREARMGVFQITPRFSTEISDYGINDVSSIDKDVTAVVRMTFAIK